MSTVVQTPSSANRTTGNLVLVALGMLLLVIYMYCEITSFLFLSDCDGSFLMSRAAEVGLVSDSFAQSHPLDVVPFRHDPDGKWEYRSPLTIFGYPAIPGLVEQQTSTNLLEACTTRDSKGTFGCSLNGRA